MAVKYVKDFAFDSGFGYTGSAGKTPVRGYNRGGKVFDNSTRNPISKFPELAPAMVGKGPGKMGGKTSDVAPMSTAKANPQIAKYAKGGKVKKPPMAKPMKAKMMKKAEGGPVAEITEGDGMSPLQAMAIPVAKYKYGDDYVEIVPEESSTDALTPIAPPDEYMNRQSGPQVDWFNLWAMKNQMSPDRYEEYVQRMAPMSGMNLDQYRSYLSDAAARSATEDAYRQSDAGRAANAALQQEMNRPGRVSLQSSIPSIPGNIGTDDYGPGANLDSHYRLNPPLDRTMMGDRRDMAMRPGMRGIAQSKARRAMPVAPRAPMIQIPREPQGGVMTFAKGGKVSKGEQKIGKVMGEYKRGELHSGSKKGPVVTNPKQAKAIALSEARAAGAKIPKKAMGGKACG